MPEAPFGAEPDDMAGAEETSAPIFHGGPALPSGAGPTAQIRLVRTADGAEPYAITVIVPEKGGYEDSVRRGRTYTFFTGRYMTVAAADVEWLIGHPAYEFEQQP